VSNEKQIAIQLQAGFDANEANKKEKMTTEYIIDKIESSNYEKLSPRSKEVYMIVHLIKNCFHKYNKAPKTQLELYKIGKMLGKGAFGKVNLGLHRLTRKLVAIKSINMDFMKEESQKKKIMNEINILKSLRHPNNIKILETF
jgi:serine/threonine protein kinase